MTVETELARGVLSAHPVEAARVLERLPADEAARAVASAEMEAATGCLRAMHGPAASAILGEVEPRRAAEIVEALPTDAASALLRRLDAEARERILGDVRTRLARSLRSLLRFDPHTAGGLMDPDVLALPVDLSVSEARTRVREAARHARYNLYAVDRDQRLVGVFNLRELFLAEPEALLSSIVRRDVHRLPADADRHAIVSHPGWREVHSLPVVDPGGLYLGAVRYRTLRRLEEELRGGRTEAGETARALGDLFRTGASSLLEAVAASAPTAPVARRAPDVP